jgi:hypothetical protein
MRENGPDEPHTQEHSHGELTHSHPYESPEHDHVEHEHEHSHGELTHSHLHTHEAGGENDHSHEHDSP